MKFRLILLLATIALASTACAEESSAPAEPAAKPVTAAPPIAPPASGDDATALVRTAIATLVPDATIDSISDAAIPGFYEVALGGQLVYVSADGRYLLQGSIYDIANKTDLTEASRASVRKQALAGVPKAEKITFEAADPKHRVTVFTDIDCGYCRRMHAQIAEYNTQGISVDYLFFPRSGLGTDSFDKAVSVYCAADRNAALTAAKESGEIAKASCANPIESQFALGNKIGVSGTPAVITADGMQVGGYVPPEQLRQRLDELATKPALN